MPSEELRVNKEYICTDGDSRLSPSNLYQAYFVWEHTIISEGSFIVYLLFLTANFLM